MDPQQPRLGMAWVISGLRSPYFGEAVAPDAIVDGSMVGNGLRYAHALHQGLMWRVEEMVHQNLPEMLKHELQIPRVRNNLERHGAWTPRASDAAAPVADARTL